MESSAEHVHQEPNEHVPVERQSHRDPQPEYQPDEYAQSELESRKRRIEMSVQKALRTT